MRDWRWQLTAGEDQINTATWAGSVPHVNGIAPRVRVGRSKWFNLLWLLPIGLVLLLVAVAVAKGLRGDPVIQQFIARYPGTLYSARATAATGFPAWLQWQHCYSSTSWFSSSSTCRWCSPPGCPRACAGRKAGLC